MDQEKIGNIIKKIRKNNNLTQNDLANSLGVTYQAVSKWENGKNIPDIAILKEISKKYNVDITELLDVENKKVTKVKSTIGIILFIIIVIISLSILIMNKEDNFNMQEIKSSCEYYDIKGVVAYTKSKSSIYISDIEYCGKKDENLYRTITCNLYEKLNDKTTKITSCKRKKNTTLEEFLKEVKINVDNYKSMCNKFSKAELYLEIETDKGEGINTHKIPLELDDDCN